MQQLRIKVRARSSTEAANLGLMAARQYFLSLLWIAIPMWLLTVIGATWLWMITNSAHLAIITLWWFKPLYERPAVKQLSNLIFNQKTAFWQAQRAIFAKGWLAEITYKRPFAGNRIIRHAVNLLEGVEARERGQRIKTCALIGDAWRWALVLPVFEALLIYTMMTFMPGLPDIPNLADLLALNVHNEETLTVIAIFVTLMTAFYFVVCLLSTIFFVSIGFMLYLNSRIINEGWAISLDIQALAKRLLSICVLILALSSFTFLSSPHAFAITEIQRAQDHEWVEEIVNDPELTPYTLQERRIPYGQQQQSSHAYNPPSGEAFAEYVRLFLIIMLIIAIITLIWQVRRRAHLSGYPQRKHHDTKAVAKQDVLSYGYAIDSLDKAIQHWQTGDMLSALAVIYTRLASQPQHHQIITFAVGETESDYLARAQPTIAPNHYDFLQAFFKWWQLAAYGQQTVPAKAVEELISHYRTLWL